MLYCKVPTIIGKLRCRGLLAALCTAAIAVAGAGIGRGAGGPVGVRSHGPSIAAHMARG